MKNLRKIGILMVNMTLLAGCSTNLSTELNLEDQADTPNTNESSEQQDTGNAMIETEGNIEAEL